MHKIGEKLIQLILKHSLSVIIFTSVLTLVALFFIPHIKFDNSVDVFFDKKSKSYIDFQKWKEQFGSDDVVVVAFSDRDIFSEENLKLISLLTERFESLEYVNKVTSLTNVNDIIGYESDFIVKPLIETIPSDRNELEELKEHTLSNPLYLKNVISGDAKTTAIIVELEHRPKSEDIYKKEVIENINKILKEDFPQKKKYYISGPTAIEFFYASFMQEDFKTFLPLIFVIILIVLIFSFHNLVGFILPLLVIMITLLWTMALLYLHGFSINNVTTVIPPVMLSITLLESIHFVWELMQRKRTKYPQNDATILIADTMRHLFIPCFLTNITTVVGFFALLVIKVPPIRQLGWIVGVGVFFAFIITFTFLPALIKQFNLLRYLSTPETDKGLNTRFDEFLMGLTKFGTRFKFPILIVTAGLILISLWATGKIKTETSVLEYFKKDSSIYKATDFIERNLSGVHFLNISLKGDGIDYFKQPQALKEIERLQNFLKEIPEVDKTTSVVDYIKEINKSFHNEDPEFYQIPSEKNLIAQYLLLYGATDLDDYVSSQWNWTTVRIRLKEHSTARLQKVILKINSFLDNINLPVNSEVVGQTVLEVNSNEAVTSGQIQSLTLAMLLIFGMMFIDFGSVSLGIISIIPNAFPLLLNFGMMGLLNIRLDSATSMISDIGIGIIVDDTIHFFHSFKESVKETGDYQHSIYKSFSLKGRPTIISSIILILGFGIVAFSKFVPTYYFGLLSAILIFNGLWSELFLSPALLSWLKPKFKHKYG